MTAFEFLEKVSMPTKSVAINAYLEPYFTQSKIDYLTEYGDNAAWIELTTEQADEFRKIETDYEVFMTPFKGWISFGPHIETSNTYKVKPNEKLKAIDAITFIKSLGITSADIARDYTVECLLRPLMKKVQKTRTVKEWEYTF